MKTKHNTSYKSDNIRVTRSLLEKTNRTEDEERAVKEHLEYCEFRNKNIEDADKEIVENCKMFFSGMENSAIPCSGWRYPIEEFCYQVEYLNHTFKKYGLKAVADQIKEKFGGFRCYYSIMDYPTGLRGVICRFLDRIASRLEKRNFGWKTIVDELSKRTLEWDEIDEEDFNNLVPYGNMKDAKVVVWDDNSFKIKSRTHVSKGVMGYDYSENYDYVIDKNDKEYNIEECEFFKKEGDKYYRSYVLHHSQRCHRVPTKNKMLWHLKNCFRRTCLFFENFGRIHNKNECTLREILDIKVSKLLRECEDECSKRCSVCGQIIGTENNPICSSSGWIRLYCEECAMIYPGSYYKNGTLYHEGHVSKNKKGSR